jgi:hypothetical protein
MKNRFDPRFVVVKVVDGSAHEAAYKELCRRGMEYLGSHEGVQKLNAFLDKTKITTDAELERLSGRNDIKVGRLRAEDIGSLRLCDLVNGMSGHIVGAFYKKLLHWVGIKGGIKTKSDIYSANSGDKMDLFFLTVGREILGKFSMEELSTPGDGKETADHDMSLANLLIHKARSAVSSQSSLGGPRDRETENR